MTYAVQNLIEQLSFTLFSKELKVFNSPLKSLPHILYLSPLKPEAATVVTSSRINTPKPKPGQKKPADANNATVVTDGI